MQGVRSLSVRTMLPKTTPFRWVQGREQRRSGLIWNPCRASWIENSAKRDIEAPDEICYQLWLDRELVPAWMPWIDSVKVLKEDEALSCWVLKTQQFGREWELTWIARNLEPIPLRKVHWKSEKPPPTFKSPGTAVELENTGSVRFAAKTSTSCVVTLSISYQIPEILFPFATLLSPLVEGVLADNLRRFEKYALSSYKQQSKMATQNQDQT